jgi:hypothetical protein
VSEAAFFPADVDLFHSWSRRLSDVSDTIRQLGIEQSWYQFREEALAENARNWLEEHELPYR